MEEDKVIKGQPRSFTKKLKDAVEDKEHQIEIDVLYLLQHLLAFW